jgi:VWFA-related protein
MRLLHRIALVQTALSLLAGPLTLAAQEEPTPLFVERVDVNVVNVEVWVTDQKGKRVVGLAQQDFEIFEDGQPVEISNFYATARPDRVLETVDEVPSPEVPPQMVPPDQVLNLLVLVDHFNSMPANRNRALDQMSSFLEDRVRQGDRVMLVGYNGSIEIVEPLTSDQERISAGLRRLEKAGSQRPMKEAERRRRLIDMTLAADQADSRTAYDIVRRQVQQERQELRQTAKAIYQIVRSLSGLPGRKAVLYLSDGLPQRPGEDFYQQLLNLFGGPNFSGTVEDTAIFDPFLETIGEDESPLLNRIAREANGNQVTFYTVDTRGAAGASSLSPETPGLAAGASGRTALDASRTMNNLETLIDMAISTGGSTVFNTFNFEEAVTSFSDDFDSFYSLGYRKEGGGDGEFHEIEVRVKQPGLKVRHRRGYLDKPQQERIADRTVSSLLLDVEKNSLGIQVDFGVVEKKGRGRFHLPVMVRVPLSKITLLPTGAAEEGRLRFYIAVRDEKGGISDLHEHSYPLSIPADQVDEARGSEVGYTTTLELRPGLPKVVAAVWDEVSGTDSFVHKQVRVGKD